jgi:hypothetical protein
MACAASDDTVADSRAKGKALGQRTKQMQKAAKHRLAVEQGVASYVQVKERPRNPRKDLEEADRFLHKICPVRSADKRDVKYIPVGNGEAMPHQRRYRPWSMDHLRTAFNKTAQVQLGDNTFREAECGCISTDKRRVCVCDYCDGGERDLKTLHKNRVLWHQRAVKNGVKCSTCKTGAGCKNKDREAPFWRISRSWTDYKQITMCTATTIGGHIEYPLQCAERRCQQCKNRASDLLLSCEIENSEDPFSWPEYQNIQRSGWEQKILVPVTHDGSKHTRKEFMERLVNRGEKNKIHDWTVVHQANAHVDRDAKVEGQGVLLTTADFIQKYTHQRNTDTTCERKIQTTILAIYAEHSPRQVEVAQKKRRWKMVGGEFAVDPVPIYNVNRLLDQDAHLILTPEKEQDQAMYGKAMTDITLAYKNGLLPDLNEVFVQSDRCAYQFWASRNFAYIARFHEEVEGVTMQHDTTAPKHGKGKADGVGAHVKVDADKAEMQEEDAEGNCTMMLDAAAMYEVERNRISIGVMYPDWNAEQNSEIPPANINDGTLAENAITRRKMYLLPAGYMDRSNLPEYQTIKGTRIIYHSARGCGDKSKILMRRFSCFCGSCMVHKYTDCETRELIGIWNERTGKYNNDWVKHSIVQLQGRGIAKRRKEEGAAAKAAADSYAQAIEIGEWLTVDCAPGDEEGFGFWLAKAKSKSYHAETDYTDGVTEIKAGDHVIDLEYYVRSNPEDALEFEPEADPATVHIESLFPVKGISVSPVEGTSEVLLDRGSSLQVMSEYQLKHSKQRVI